MQRLSRPARLVRVLQLAYPRHLSGLLHRLCWPTVSLGYLTVSLHRLCVSLHLLPISLGGLGGAWHNAWLCLRLCLRLGEVGV